jgi:hypothetical protein
MRTSFHRSVSIASSALAAAVLVGCQGSGGTIEVGLTSSGQPLTAITAASDGGTSGDATIVGPRLMLDITRIDVHVAGDGMPDDPPGGLTGTGPSAPPAHDGGWISVFSGAASVDLLQTGSVEAFLGSAPTPAGKVTQIRLVLAAATWVDGASVTPVACPSCTQTGLKIVTMGKLFVPNGGTLHVTLDFDAEHSLHTGTDGFRLDPVIKIARSDTR